MTELGGAKPPTALYLHVPFCVSQCPYCDFVVVAGREARGPSNRIGAFSAALEAELQLRADALDAGSGTAGTGSRPTLASVYLGGGTPSLLPSASIARLLGIIRARFGIEDDGEVTLEVNPGASERGDAAAHAAAGITRVSIGAQSFDAVELRTLGRRHGPADVAATVAAARAQGIASISIDLLYDVPGQTVATWTASLDAALALEPDHLSLYALALDDPDAEGLTGPAGDHLPVSAGARRWRRTARAGQDDDRASELYELAERRLADAGFGWYEISNWSRPGHESRHNLAYWQGAAWEAVGPGAHAFDGVTRRWTAARLDAYLAALTPPDGAPSRLPPGGSEPAAATETIMLDLRTRDGVPSAALDGDHGDALRWGLDHELLERAGERLALTVRGRLLANELFERFVEVETALPRR